MPLCPQRLRLLMHIKAIRRIIRQPVNHHQYPHAATSFLGERFVFISFFSASAG